MNYKCFSYIKARQCAVWGKSFDFRKTHEYGFGAEKHTLIGLVWNFYHRSRLQTHQRDRTLHRELATLSPTLFQYHYDFRTKVFTGPASKDLV